MSEIANVSQQYDDLVGEVHGEIAVDGESRLMIPFDIPRSCLPRGYVPIALEFYYSAERGEKHLSIAILAMDRDILSVVSADGIRTYARENCRLPVHRFPTDLRLGQLLPLVKRCTVLLRDSSTEDAPLMVIGG